MNDSLAGKLLVATPDLTDPNFFRAVVLIVEHDDKEGALGLVLNRPSDAEVVEYLPEWARVAADPAVVFVGGPVTPDVAIGLVESPHTAPQDWSPAVGDIGLADLGLSPDDVDGVARCRVFAGYAGWVPGQLEMEVAFNSWFVVEALDEDIFCSEPDGLWRSVLRRQPPTLSWFANFPDDIRLN